MERIFKNKVLFGQSLVVLEICIVLRFMLIPIMSEMLEDKYSSKNITIYCCSIELFKEISTTSTMHGANLMTLVGSFIFKYN